MDISADRPTPMAASPGSGSTSSTRCAAPSDPARPQLVYGRRRGRPLRPGRRALIAELLPQLVIELPAAGEFDPRRLFGAEIQRIWLEIGFGGGEHLAWQAERHPETGFLGCEVFENGIARLLAEIEQRRLANIRLLTDDARRLLAALPAASVDRVFILFPDPWPKERHKKRRLMTRETLDRLAAAMRGGGELRLATDDSDYLAWMIETAAAHPAFASIERHERPADWPPTRYEEKARRAGRAPFFLRYVRRPRGLT
jgi:tRNA (guanine-N7-)-methyltransferase